MKKLLLTVLTIFIASNPLVAIEKVTVEKAKAALTSKQAYAVYGILFGAGVGAGAMYFIQKMIHRKAFQKLQEEKDHLEKILLPGIEVAQAIKNNEIIDVIGNYFQAEHQKNVVYGFADLKKNGNGFLMKDTVICTYFKDLQKEQDEAAHNKLTIKAEETEAFAKVKPYSDAFKKLYHDMCEYNVSLKLNGKKAWDVQLLEQDGAPFMRGIYINPPVEQEEQEKMRQSGSKIAQAIENNNVADVIKNYFGDITAATYKDDGKNRKAFVMSDALRAKLEDDVQKEIDEAKSKNREITFIETKAWAKVEPFPNYFRLLYRDMCEYNAFLKLNGKKEWDVELLASQSNGVWWAAGVYINPPAETDK